MKESQKKEAALQDCEQQAIAVCERYGLQNASANAAFRQTQYILYCDLTASADGVSDLEFQDQYRADIRRYLTLSSWHYSAEMADEIMSMPGRARAIEQAFEEKEPAADIAVDVGYFCG